MHFYFLRHGETDHNKHFILDDPSDIGLNAHGVEQARNAYNLIRPLKFDQVMLSPMQRVLETKNIIQPECKIPSLILPEFTECTYSIWSDLNKNIDSLSDETKNFINRIKIGLDKTTENSLIIAHGGTFWALCHLLKINKNRIIPNCQLVKFFQDTDLKWDYEYVSKQTFFTKNPQEIPYFYPKVTVVSCFIEHAGTILLLQKNAKNSVWGVPGGKLEKSDLNELQGLTREVYEEISLTISSPNYIGERFTRIPGYPDYILHIYHIILKSRPEITLSDEHSQAKWVPIHQFKNYPLLNQAQVLAFDTIYTSL